MNFSKYATFEELTDSENHPELVAQNRIDAMEYLDNGRALSALFADVRHELGDKPVKANSGYRNLKLNYAVGSIQDGKEGRTLSNHCRFKAVDATPIHITVQEAFDKLMEAKKAGRLPTLRKVLQEGSWLHLEVMIEGDDYRGFFVSHDGNKTWEKVA